MTKAIAGAWLLVSASIVWGQQLEDPARKSDTPESLRAEIEALKPTKLAWRQIAWKSCLLDGLKESREQSKPVLLWIFIDRPADDGRC